MKGNPVTLKCLFRLFILTCALFARVIPVNAAEPKVDFNGDGKADLFLRNAFGGENKAWLANGGTVLQKLTLPTMKPSGGWTILDLKDVNGDGKTDVLWFNPNTGGVKCWFINAGRLVTGMTYPTVSLSNGYLPIAVEDFNDDGRADLLLRNVYTGAIRGWLLNDDGTMISGSSVNFGTLAPNSDNAGWTLLGVKDLNCDGCADLLWYNTNTGYVASWLLNGDGISYMLNYPNYPPVNLGGGWVPIGLEDLNGDGFPDLIQRNIYDGKIIGWLLNGLGYMRSVSFGQLSPTSQNAGWTPVALTDLSGDDCADLLWYNTVTGELKAWLLNGNGYSSSVSYASLKAQGGWIPLAFDDFDGDGITDVFWRNAYTNATKTWLLGSVGILNNLSYGPIPASAVWQIQGAR